MGSSSFSNRLDEKIIREACASHARCRRLIADYNVRTPKADAGAEVIAPTRRVAIGIERTARENAFRQRFTVTRRERKAATVSSRRPNFPTVVRQMHAFRQPRPSKDTIIGMIAVSPRGE